jgi:hypothetical protein
VSGSFEETFELGERAKEIDLAAFYEAIEREQKNLTVLTRNQVLMEIDRHLPKPNDLTDDLSVETEVQASNGGPSS